jgi:hypothetical protein
MILGEILISIRLERVIYLEAGGKYSSRNENTLALSFIA